MTSTPLRRAWALSLGWIAVIAIESFAGSSEHTSRLIYPILHFLFPKITFLRMFQVHYLVRKLGHFSGYGILSLTLYRSWWTTLNARATPTRLSWSDLFKAWSGRAMFLALLGTLAVAGLDEFHQSFSPGRTASIVDVGLDEMGGLFVQLVIVVVSSVAVTRRKRHPETSLISS